MSNKTDTQDLNIKFIHLFKRSTRTEWPDKFRLCAYFGESDRSFRFYPITFSSSFSSLPVLP